LNKGNDDLEKGLEFGAKCLKDDLGVGGLSNMVAALGQLHCTGAFKKASQ
jgi:hypothetical protein